ncbi:MAG: NUDIX domain-containing protein [Chloroflexia bacterium]|nr:NUDIX domain-containing protein [Chloroflexia bacterium]
MGATGYLGRLRGCVGHDLLLVPAVAACIRDAQGRILLLRRSEGVNLWGFPGGAIEPGEGAEQALKREVYEEVGLRIEPVTLIGVYSSPEYAFAYPNGDQVQPVTSLFECRVLGGKLEADMQEVIEARYYSAEDPLPPMRPCCVAKARDAFSFHGRAFFR